MLQTEGSNRNVTDGGSRTERPEDKRLHRAEQFRKSLSLDLSVDQLSNQHLHAEIKMQLQERGSDFMLSVCFGVIHLLLPACDG